MKTDIRFHQRVSAVDCCHIVKQSSNYIELVIYIVPFVHSPVD